MKRISVSKFEIVLSFSAAFDLIDKKIMNHHHNVAYLVMEILEELDINIDEKIEIVIAALMHDIGAFKLKEKLGLLNYDYKNLDNHAKNGYYLLLNYPPFFKIGTIIKHHHDNWENGKTNNKIHIGSYIIEIADRIEIYLQKFTGYTRTVKLEKLLKKENGKMFMPELVDIVSKISKKEEFWKNFDCQNKEEAIFNRFEPYLKKEDLKDILGLGKLFSQIIDFRSRFTAVHSTGVAYVSREISKLMGYDDYTQTFMLLAGYLHDIGKLAVPNEILEKNASLTKEELRIVRTHPYHSYMLLKKVKAFDELCEVAAYHHEKLSGKGYPFALDRKSLNQETRIMAVSDIFTALSEERPYRNIMKKEKIIQILNAFVKADDLDSSIVQIVIDNIDFLMKTNLEIQNKVKEQYVILDEIIFK